MHVFAIGPLLFLFRVRLRIRVCEQGKDKPGMVIIPFKTDNCQRDSKKSEKRDSRNCWGEKGGKGRKDGERVATLIALFN